MALQNALEDLDAIIGAGLPALFLDFDGTLAEIAPRPCLVALPDSVRAALQALRRVGVPLAFVSGRDLDDLRRRVGIEEAAYAGSHGFDMLGPPPECVRFQPGIDSLPALDQAERALRSALESVAGAFMERKRFAFAVHYRQVADAAGVGEIERAVAAALRQWPGLQLREGKKVFELVPQVRWDKGRAVLWFMERMGIAGRPVYIGDDLTDEDAFAVLRHRGTGIVVQERVAPTAATSRLRNPAEVERFLLRLAGRLQR